MKYVFDISKELLGKLIDDNMSLSDAEKIIKCVKNAKPYRDVYERGITIGYKMALQDLNIIGKDGE